MYIRVVILLRTFNPPNVAELKIDHVSLVVWYKHFDRRLMWALFLRTVQPYRQFLDINSLLYRPKIARELTIPSSLIHCYANPATTYIDRTSIIPRSFILCRVKRATSKTTKEDWRVCSLFLVLLSTAEPNKLDTLDSRYCGQPQGQILCPW